MSAVQPPTTPARLDLMGFPLDPLDLAQAADRIGAWLSDPARTPHTVITLNPEFIVQAQTDERFARSLRAADLSVADGVGVVWAARQLLGQDVPRAPGFDLTAELMRRHGPALRVYFLGGRPGVAEQAAARAAQEYGVTVAGVQHGYFQPDEDARIANAVRDAAPHLLLTGMGAPRQENFNQDWRQIMGVPVCMGIGGTLDVMSGTVQLSPEWTRKAGVEWVWRVFGDRKRWGRAPRLARFVQLVRAEKRSKGRKV